MTVTVEELEGGIAKVILDGRLDIEGVTAVDLRMNLIAGSHKLVLVDMQKLAFVGSIGLRSLVIPARTIKSRGGKVVLFAPNEMVEKVLQTSGISTLIPIYHDLPAALAALQ